MKNKKKWLSLAALIVFFGVSWYFLSPEQLKILVVLAGGLIGFQLLMSLILYLLAMDHCSHRAKPSNIKYAMCRVEDCDNYSEGMSDYCSECMNKEPDI